MRWWAAFCWHVACYYRDRVYGLSPLSGLHEVRAARDRWYARYDRARNNQWEIR